MRKVISYTLEYRQKGEKKFKEIKVDFISNWVIREQNKITQAVYDIKAKWDKINYNIADVAALETEKPKGYKDEIKKLNAEIVELTQDIEAYGDGGILEERFNIIKQILEDNQVKDDDLYNYDFWDRCVDPLVQMDFLNSVVWKDLDKKKVV